MCCKYYIFNTMYIKLHKISWKRKQQNLQKFYPHENQQTYQPYTSIDIPYSLPTLLTVS